MKLLVIILTLTFNTLYSQKYSQNIMVISEEGINLRMETSLNSTKITSIEMGTIIKRDESFYKKDTINNMKGFWYKVKYLKYEGYVFNAYVSEVIKQYNPEFHKNYPQILTPKPFFYNCTDNIYYDNNLNWYEISPNINNIQIKKVKCHIELSSDKVNDQDDWTGGFPNSYLKLRCNSTDSILFLIGLPNNIPNSIIKYINIPEHKINNSINKFLFPGQVFDIGYNSDNKTIYKISAIGTVKDDAFNYCTKIDDYELRISEIKNKKWKTQNLLTNIKNLGECNTPEIIFVGDIDNDKVPDIIIQTTSNSLYQIHLFLSSYSDDNNIVKRVAVYKAGNCY